MHTMHSAFHEAWNDPASALIKYAEGRAAILYGVRAFKCGDHIEFQAAYDGDYYRPLPSHLVDVILQNGWRAGLCMLAADRCDDSIEWVNNSLNKELSNPAPDKKRVEHFDSMLKNLYEKRKTFLNQIQNHE